MSAGAERGSVFLEPATVLVHDSRGSGQFLLQLQAPRCAAAATPGSFVHLACGPGIPMRRPLSLLRAAAAAGRIELLYRVVGHGLQALTARRPGEVLSCLGPIGRGFKPRPERPRALLIGGGVGIPPLIFLAETLAADRGGNWQPLLLAGSEVPWPLATRPAALAVAGMPDAATHALTAIEERGVPNRLASRAGLPGCHDDHVTALAAHWLAGLSAAERAIVAIYACGPPLMLRAAASLARRYDLPCEVSLEERMACGVGGCAGCAVEVQTAAGPSMQRVCVDGPVFDATTVFG
ncbi:MAG: dihydroorotate dehydrogenase electron transfer subunit [Gammaproteobacteria bacterium]|nr:dihydroorotate dehydrogenase electron transfer subunit [Gammaproteobacteria bacterium]